MGVLDEKLIQKLCQAAEINNVEEIKKLLFMKKNVADLKDKQGNVALHYAVSNENLQAMEVLLQNGANPDVKDEDDLTSLHIAVGQGCWDIAAKLLQVGANPNAKDNEGNTPLHFAAEGNDLKLLRLLEEKEGNIDAKNSYD